MKKGVLTALIFSLVIVLASCGDTENTQGGENMDTNSQETSTNNHGGDKETNSEQTNNNSESVDQIMITMADHVPSGHFLLDAAETFQQRVEELTEGHVTFEYYPNEQLGAISETAGLVKDGAVDLAYVHIDSATFLPLSSVAGLPSAINSSSVGGEVFDELLNGILSEELEKNNLKPIYSFVNPPASILSAEKQLESIEDVKGLKIRASGAVLGEIPELLGGTSVTLNLTEIYEAMQRGVVDAAIMNIANAPNYHFEEVTNHVLTGSNFGWIAQFYAMNMDVWNSLPRNVQEAFVQAGEEATVDIGEYSDELEKKSLKLFENEGIGITKLSAEQNEEVMELLAPLDEIWLENMEERGVDGTEVLNAYREASEKGSTKLKYK